MSGSDQRLVVYCGRELSDILFTKAELLDDYPEGKERLKSKVEVLQRKKEI